MKNECIEPSDPRLTAFALAEMSPEESVAFETELENSPAARNEIERIRETATLLREEFGAELEAAFTPQESAVPALTVVEPIDQRPIGRRAKFRAVITGIAAVLLAAAAVTATWMNHGGFQENTGIDENATSKTMVTGADLVDRAEEDPAADPTIEAAAVPTFYLASAEADKLLRSTRSYHGGAGEMARGRSEMGALLPIDSGRMIPAAGGVGPGRDNGFVPAVSDFGFAIDGLSPSVSEVGNYFEVAGQITGDGHEEIRSTYMVGKSTDAQGNTAVKLKGRIQVTQFKDNFVEVAMEGADGEKVVGRAREATTNPVTGDVVLAGGPPFLQRGDTVLRPTSKDARIILKPDGSHLVEGRSRVKFQIKGDGEASGPQVGESLDTLTAPTLADTYSAATPQPATAPAPAEGGGKLLAGENLSKNRPMPDAGASGVGGGGSISVLGDSVPVNGAAPVKAGGSIQSGSFENRSSAVSPGKKEPGYLATFGRPMSESEQRAKELAKKPAASPPVMTAAPLKSADEVDAFSSGNTQLANPRMFGGMTAGSGATALHATAGLSQPSDGFGRGWKESAPQPVAGKQVPGSGKFAPTTDNPFKDPMETALSTFSVDVDTASFTEVRRMILKDGHLPDRDQVRVEEFINYFKYHSYETPDLAEVKEAEGTPFSVNLDSAAAPWNPGHRIVRIGLKGADFAAGKRPSANLVFLLDVSGSMSPEDKLPLMQKSLRELVPKLREDDRITMVVYASKAGEVLEPTEGSDSKTILEAVNALSAKGSTNGEGGIRIAYQRARENFIEGGVNRILLATDGDFNVGQDSDEELVSLIEKEAKSGIELTVLGFGTGNLNDSMLEKITNKGNGQFHYIDRIEEGRRVLVEEMNSSLVTIANDVKIQVEFNPGKVAAYRLIGYANRIMPREDFNDDTRDAGEIGAGHTVTALYEVVPVEAMMKLTQAEPVEDLKYKKPAVAEDGEILTPMEQRRRALKKRGIDLVDSPELLTLKLRYKHPGVDQSEKLEFPLVDAKKEFADASADFRFATAVGAFGEWLRIIPAPGSWSAGGNPQLTGGKLRVPIQQGRSNHQLQKIARIAHEAIEGDEFGRKKEFVEMIKAAAKLNGGRITIDAEAADPEPEKGPGVEKSVKEKLKQLR